MSTWKARERLTERAKNARFNLSSVKKRARPPYDPSVSEIIATPPANFTAMIDVPVTIGLVVRVDGMVRSMFVWFKRTLRRRRLSTWMRLDPIRNSLLGRKFLLPEPARGRGAASSN